MIIGSPRIQLTEIDSTNNYAAQLVKENLVNEGTAVIAEFQTQGKGRRGNEWNSEKGDNILCTVILKPKFLHANEQFLLSMAMILALKTAVETHLINTKVSIKWPNDLIVGNKKIAGLLIENTLSGSQIVSSLVGFGINVNQTRFSVTHSIFQPVSLVQLGIENITKVEVLEKCFEKLQQYYFKLMNLKFAELEVEYHQSLLFMNETCEFFYQNEKLKAIFKGVKRNGFAKIETEQGIVEANMDELRFISPV